MIRETALSNLLGALFSAEELRVHLAQEPESNELVAALPEVGVSLARLATEAVLALRRRGLIDRDFFERLEDVRPRFVSEIRKARMLWIHNAVLDRDELWADGRYQLISSLGHGGFGLVWKAIDTQTGSLVALKILLEQHAEDRRVRQRFFRGAAVLAGLSHSAIVRVLSNVEQEGLRYFYVMEFLEGENLEALVGRRPRDELLGYILQIGDALGHIHAREILHRDVKPSNILVTTRGHAKLVDFDSVTGDSFRSMTTRAIGTAFYTPPEARAYTKKTAAYDVFSLARTVEFVLRGREPAADDFTTLDTVATLDTPEAVKAVLRAALCTDLTVRTTSAERFCADLQVAMKLQPKPIRAPVGLFSSSPKFALATVKDLRWHQLAWPAVGSLAVLFFLIIWRTLAIHSLPVKSLEETARVDLSSAAPLAIPAKRDLSSNIAAIPQPKPFVCSEPALTGRAGIEPMCFVNIPAGEFTMGSPMSELNRDMDENQHKASVMGFAIGIHEVTLGQWKAVMNSAPHPNEFGSADNHPVTIVSWNDVCEFMIKLTLQENRTRREQGKPALEPCYVWNGEICLWKDQTCTGYRLPTETEWEYAARAGSQTAYSFGDDQIDLCRNGNGADQSAMRELPQYGLSIVECDDGHAGLAPVRQFPPNAWGLHDIHGNVSEFVWDRYAEAYEIGASAPGYAGPEAGENRVSRGGSFWLWPGTLRSADRYEFSSTDKGPTIGFRCVRGSPNPAPPRAGK